MPILHSSKPFHSPFWLPEKHSQSIFPALFREVYVAGVQVERITLSDGDFVDVDWYLAGQLGEKPLLIISHGLEGSSRRHYVLGIAKKAISEGFDVLAWNYRSCSGEMNRARKFYHSGATDDLDQLVNMVIERGVKEVYFAGFSLGGNLTLKWLGEKGKNPPSGIRKAVVFSVPLHLSSSSQTLAKLENWMYSNRFLKTLVAKVQQKVQQFPDLIPEDKLSQINTLWDFDEIVTGPIHGFAGAEDYYQQSSSIFFLPQIHVPVLIVNAANDPFLSPQCFPTELISSLEHVFLEIPKEGGHCGFYPRKYDQYLWSEIRGMNWLKEEV